MAGGRFAKQATYRGGLYLNSNNSGDQAVGGLLTTAPTGYNLTAGEQTLPGDRIILSPSDAVAWSNPAVGNMGSGTYRYVGTQATSVSNPTRGHGAFWVNNNNGGNLAQDALYQVTSDEPANQGINLFAGVFISSNLAKGNWWWIQESGKSTLAFRNVITGTPAIGAGVYLAAAGNNANATDVGAFDVMAGSNTALTMALTDNMLQRYVGPSESLPGNNNTALVDMVLRWASFRW